MEPTILITTNKNNQYRQKQKKQDNVTMDTTEILNTKISLCRNIRAKSYHTITLFEALNSIRKGTYADQVENIRRLYRNGNENYDTKKKQLPAFIFCGRLYDTRHKFDIFGYTSLLVIDIDKLDNTDETKAVLSADPYVVGLWTSPSGKGLKALFYIKYDKYYSQTDAWIYHEHCAFPQASEYLCKNYGINIDQTGKDITRLCFVSYDPEIHLKRKFEPFHVNCNLSKKSVNRIRAKYYRKRQIRQRINEMKHLSQLIHNQESQGLSSFEPMPGQCD